MADLITTATAANIWKALTKELRRPGAEGQRKMAAAAMAADTSTDHIESKAIIAKVISSAARKSPWRRWSAIQRPSFIGLGPLVSNVVPTPCRSQVAYGIVQDTPELNEACSSVKNEQDFIQALAAHFLKEPALSARAETYDTLGLPPPDETGAHAFAHCHLLRSLFRCAVHVSSARAKPPHERCVSFYVRVRLRFSTQEGR